MARKKFSQLRERLRERDPEADRKIDVFKAEMERELTLAELRRALDFTQQQIAASLDTNQSGVSRIEHQTDLFISTLRSYIEAMGGRLELRAIFPDGEVSIRTIEEIERFEPVGQGRRSSRRSSNWREPAGIYTETGEAHTHGAD